MFSAIFTGDPGGPSPVKKTDQLKLIKYLIFTHCKVFPLFCPSAVGFIFHHLMNLFGKCGVVTGPIKSSSLLLKKSWELWGIEYSNGGQMKPFEVFWLSSCLPLKTFFFKLWGIENRKPCDIWFAEIIASVYSHDGSQSTGTTPHWFHSFNPICTH